MKRGRWLTGVPRPSPQYMGCVEVLQSMRALDFNTRTQVTRRQWGLGEGQSQDS